MQGTQNAYMDRAILKGIGLIGDPYAMGSMSCTDKRFLADTKIVSKQDMENMICLTYEDLADKVERYNPRESGAGTLTRSIPIEEMKKRIRTTYSEFADRLGGLRKDLVEIVDDQSIDMVRMDAPKEEIEAFDRRTEYNSLLKKREELGLSLEKAIDSDGTERFVHIQNYMSNSPGIVLSSSYVKDALRASDEFKRLMKQDGQGLKKALAIAKKYFTKDAYTKARQEVAKKVYVSLIEKGDWDSLKRAMQVATKYFLSLESEKANKLIDHKLDQRAMAMADDAISGCLRPETSKEVYTRLVRMNCPSTLAKAKEFAKLYMNRQAAEDTAELLARAVEARRVSQRKETLNKKEDIKVREQPKPILYFPENRMEKYVREVKDIAKPKAEPQKKAKRIIISDFGAKENISLYEAQCFAEAAENALRHEFMKRKGNVISECLKAPSYGRTELARRRAERLPGGSTLPAHPDLETFLSPPTQKDIKVPKKKMLMVSTIPPLPPLPRKLDYPKMYNRPMNLEFPPTKRIIITPEMRKILRAA